METIKIETITISEFHRDIKPDSLKRIKESMEEHGYNIAYPIVVDNDNILAEGRHRLRAAIDLGMDEVPFIRKPDGVSNIRFNLRANADGLLCMEDDVFDLAELCYRLAEKGWTGQEIADELGWNETATVTRYKNIKLNLYSRAWELTRNGDIVNGNVNDTVNQELTIVNWTESHFRKLLKHLSCPDGNRENRAMMRAQVAAIYDIIARANEKDKRFGATKKTVTAVWIEKLAKKYAWHTQLAIYMRDNLVELVSIRDRIDLLKNIRNNVYGEKSTDNDLEKFEITIARLNEQVLGVTLIHGDNIKAMTALFDDKTISLVVTDPPYNVTENEWDKIGTDEEYLDFLSRWLEALRPKLADDYHLFFFCDPDYAARIEELLISDNWPLLSRIIWSNRSLPSGRMVEDRFVRTWQMIFHVGTHGLNWSPDWSDERFDVQVCAAPNANTKDGGYHPTAKPIKLIEHLVRIGSKPTDLVLDCFAGGGVTGEACKNIRQRLCFLIEKDEKYCGVIENRLNIRRAVW